MPFASTIMLQAYWFNMRIFPQKIQGVIETKRLSFAAFAAANLRFEDDRLAFNIFEITVIVFVFIEGQMKGFGVNGVRCFFNGYDPYYIPLSL
jgi:hypothetical protein